MEIREFNTIFNFPKLLHSATRIVLLMFSFVLAIVFGVVVLHGLSDDVTTKIIDLFKDCILLVLGFYFGKSIPETKRLGDDKCDTCGKDLKSEPAI